MNVPDPTKEILSELLSFMREFNIVAVEVINAANNGDMSFIVDAANLLRDVAVRSRTTITKAESLIL